MFILFQTILVFWSEVNCLLQLRHRLVDFFKIVGMTSNLYYTNKPQILNEMTNCFITPEVQKNGLEK